MSEDLKDFCLNCGKEHECCLWGAECDCDEPNVVHQLTCDTCNRILGLIIDDDYCGPEKIYCPDCMANARERKR